MKLLTHRNLWSVLFLSMVAGAFYSVYLGTKSHAQEKTQVPARTGYVNDFAQVVDDTTRQRLDTILDSFKKRSGIELNLATVQNTGNQGIFLFSRQLASEWGKGSRGSSAKTLLLVVSVEEKTLFTQLSRSVQGELPEGILGELNQRVRGPINSGQISEGLTDWVGHFIAAIGKKLGFSLQDIDPAHSLASVASVPITEPSPTATTSNEAAAATPVETVINRDVPATSRPRIVAAPSDPTFTIDDEDESEEVELTLTLPLPERIVKLKEFLADYPNSKSKPRAIELLISSYAGLGDQKLKNGDTAGGIEQLMLAINEAPTGVSDKLFSGVVSQIPLNLFLRGQRDAAIQAAQKIETKFGADPKHSLALAGFYLGIEDGIEAVRLATAAVKQIGRAHV